MGTNVASFRKGIVSFLMSSVASRRFSPSTFTWQGIRIKHQHLLNSTFRRNAHLLYHSLFASCSLQQIFTTTSEETQKFKRKLHSFCKHFETSIKPIFRNSYVSVCPLSKNKIPFWGMLYLFGCETKTGCDTYFDNFSRLAYVQPHHSKGLGESFPLIWLN